MNYIYSPNPIQIHNNSNTHSNYIYTHRDRVLYILSVGIIVIYCVQKKTREEKEVLLN